MVELLVEVYIYIYIYLLIVCQTGLQVILDRKQERAESVFDFVCWEKNNSIKEGQVEGANRE
jgi:hypothetical protein